MDCLIRQARKEVANPRRIAFNILWYGGHAALFAVGWVEQKNNPRLAALNGLKASVWFSRGAGLCLAADGALLLLPLLRNAIRYLRPRLAWLMPLDEGTWFHRQTAYSLLFFTIVHVTAHYINFYGVEITQVRPQAAWQIHYDSPAGITGHVMLLLMLLMYTTAHHSMRKQCFEAFWYTHHLAFFFMLGLYTHATGCFVRGSLPGEPVQCLGYNSWRVTIIGGILYFCERVWREIRSRRRTRIVGVLMHPSGTMEIRFKKSSMSYRAGQWCFLCIPEVSRLQWHPFTISSAPDDPFISVHVRQVGDWTQAVGTRLGCTAIATSKTEKKLAARPSVFEPVTMPHGFVMPYLKVDGAYGAPAEDVFKYEVAVLVGAGIGVTPFASVLKDISNQRKRGTLKHLRRVEFIWLCREAESFEWFQALLSTIEDESIDFLRISIYMTGRLPTEDLWNVVINTAGQEFDALTKLRSRTYFGRPAFGQIFENLRRSVRSGQYLPGAEVSLLTRVGVFFCGSSGMAKVLQSETRKASGKSVRFTLHKEHF
ncbi:uncharacterized protein L969DRAFT_94681 [Mixia osmundae IAM 14324]|uniref:FAD-binding FR-type domain-containing protein n=1 Tax=Mixia osmundae (strain CBS 9802 / IAM 14324 / JCM 22182 / KY 12970) TaxID=764103 RepID=G7DVS9_MIXOS|nr:uncharacterized protein L969DRAFT_94681 [Mixia osmundae IAM 14324]KEI39630.1 hypothetical protein L969DRAFT_94681 [Mixia osmundae IAM 14324]GAA94689.1 hypothetical protein E5Q_01342 [Mixia osmundae IAM 14324]